MLDGDSSHAGIQRHWQPASRYCAASRIESSLNGEMPSRLYAALPIIPMPSFSLTRLIRPRVVSNDLFQIAGETGFAEWLRGVQCPPRAFQTGKDYYTGCHFQRLVVVHDEPNHIRIIPAFLVIPSAGVCIG